MLSTNTIIPNGNAAVTQAGMTLEEYRSELNANYSKYKNDSFYRKEMERKLEVLMSRGR